MATEEAERLQRLEAKKGDTVSSLPVCFPVGLTGRFVPSHDRLADDSFAVMFASLGLTMSPAAAPHPLDRVGPR